MQCDYAHFANSETFVLMAVCFDTVSKAEQKPSGL